MTSWDLRTIAELLSQLQAGLVRLNGLDLTSSESFELQSDFAGIAKRLVAATCDPTQLVKDTARGVSDGNHHFQRSQ